jgi:hypothetical protein
VSELHGTEYRVTRPFGVPFARIENLGDQPRTVFDDGQG